MLGCSRGSLVTRQELYQWITLILTFESSSLVSQTDVGVLLVDKSFTDCMPEYYGPQSAKESRPMDGTSLLPTR